MPLPQHNLFLNCLLPDSRSLILSHCHPCFLPAQSALYEAELRPRYLYFLTSGTAAAMTTMRDGMALEVGLIGREGFSGSLHMLGTGLVSTRCFMQTDGNALRMQLTTFKRLFDSVPEIRTRALEYVQSQVLTLAQLAGCNRLHTVDQRLARMLLMMHDRSDTNMLTITQELLAELLGVRRRTVTVAACLLQKQGIVEYQRGQLRVLDRSRLKQSACSCYPVVQQLYLKLYEEVTLQNKSWPAYLPVLRRPLEAARFCEMSFMRRKSARALKVVFPSIPQHPILPIPGVVSHA